MLKLYSTPTCGHCTRLKIQLKRADIGFIEVNIDGDPLAAQYVMFLTGGKTSVPTVEFPNGTALVNPTIVQIRQRLARRT